MQNSVGKVARIWYLISINLAIIVTRKATKSVTIKPVFSRVASNPQPQARAGEAIGRGSVA